jgi:hypothetical protein
MDFADCQTISTAIRTVIFFLISVDEAAEAVFLLLDDAF